MPLMADNLYLKTSSKYYNNFLILRLVTPQEICYIANHSINILILIISFMFYYHYIYPYFLYEKKV
jgi:hypothetical protein